MQMSDLFIGFQVSFSNSGISYLCLWLGFIACLFYFLLHVIGFRGNTILVVALLLRCCINVLSAGQLGYKIEIWPWQCWSKGPLVLNWDTFNGGAHKIYLPSRVPGINHASIRPVCHCVQLRYVGNLLHMSCISRAILLTISQVLPLQGTYYLKYILLHILYAVELFFDTNGRCLVQLECL